MAVVARNPASVEVEVGSHMDVITVIPGRVDDQIPRGIESDLIPTLGATGVSSEVMILDGADAQVPEPVPTRAGAAEAR